MAVDVTELGLEALDFLGLDPGVLAAGADTGLTIADIELPASISKFGVTLTPPEDARASLVIVAGNGSAPQAKVSIDVESGDELSISSPFAWVRDLPGAGALRELHNDAKGDGDGPPLVTLTATAKAAASIVLVSRTLEKDGATSFFPGLDAIGWSLNLQIAEFTMPLLNREGATDTAGATGAGATGTTGAAAAPADGDSPIGQSIQVKPTNLALEGTTASMELEATLTIGTMIFQTTLPMSFDLATFAFQVDHPSGVKILTADKTIEKPGFLGLDWAFHGVADGNLYHHLTLVTKDFNYQIRQPEGAHLDVSYTKASKDPIVFSVGEFVLGSNGLSLTADVVDAPVQLNGVDTKFRFSGSQMRIVENRIQGFTLAGSGPLPPALVGDATADIALQFEQVRGGLSLVAGGAQLRGSKLLDCKGTRFQLSIDGIGLSFVYDEAFHLYFTLTGSAKFVLQKGDDAKNGALSLLPSIQIDFVDCPLTGDASVLAKHISFLVELPKPISFPFLAAYEFELRALGFMPSFDKFDGDPAMQITGQIKFAQGKGDSADPRPDYHKLWIGLPEEGEIFPRLYMDELTVAINVGEAFKLNGTVEFRDEEDEKGFLGDGVLEIKGLPPIAASFGFLRVRRDELSPWVRAWFLYLELRRVSFRVPIVEFYIREIGLGFGYRFTLVAIKTADESKSIKELIAALKVVSRTQGDLAKRDRWAVDIEKAGEDPRWTIVFRAMIAQLSAATTPLEWNATKEKALACAYLFDVVAAVRSDLTILLNARGWISTSYGVYDEKRGEDATPKPFVSGFALLQPQKKRFLAHLANDPEGDIGDKPKLPDIVVQALKSVKFSATLLIEPGLMHFELGWPNMLSWEKEFGPLKASWRGGFIFRISTTEVVIGINFLAEATLHFEASVDLGLVGASLTADAYAGYGGRLIGLMRYEDELPVVYGAIGLELRVAVSLTLWIRIPLLFTTITLRFRFSLEVVFTASLQIGLVGDGPGLRGDGTLAVKVMGHSLTFSVHVGIEEGRVAEAQRLTAPFLHIGLEADDVQAVPGVAPAPPPPAERIEPARPIPPKPDTPPPPQPPDDDAPDRAFEVPDYSVFVMRRPEQDPDHYYFLLYPSASTPAGFLPVPPDDNDANGERFTPTRDFDLSFAADGAERWEPADTAFTGTGVGQWKARWDAQIVDDPPGRTDGEPESAQDGFGTLRGYLRLAYRTVKTDPKRVASEVAPGSDPDPLPVHRSTVEDERVHNPTDDAYEAAVRGAGAQFRGSPFFKHDPRQEYGRMLEEAFRADRTVYADDGKQPPATSNGDLSAAEADRQAHELRSVVITNLVNDLRDFVEAGPADGSNPVPARSIAFQMGLVFRLSVNNGAHDELRKLLDRGEIGTIRQRNQRRKISLGTGRKVTVFNDASTDFALNPPVFHRVRHYTDAGTIAIAWELRFPSAPGASGASPPDPDHFLQHYLVRRRPLDGRGPEAVYQSKPGAVLHRSQASLTELKPRFQVVDHFSEIETPEEIASLPITGRSYLYSITPVDFAGKEGTPLTLVATRYPNQPPPVPVDGELEIAYEVTGREAPFDPNRGGQPDLVEPQSITLRWTHPTRPRQGPRIPIGDYFLVFRPERTVPIGSYGLDSTTRREGVKLLPTSNARALPSDIRVKVTISSGAKGTSRTETVDLDALEDAGVFPGRSWRPQAWRVFFQTVSANGVESPLAPVAVLLRFTGPTGGIEERRPAELEWLPVPPAFPVLPAEDALAETGIARVPMPAAGPLDPAKISFLPHPVGIRCIRLRWNQGPSGPAAYPLDLTAGYDLLHLDIDAYGTDTFADRDKLAMALRLIQEVQMLPADDLPLVPGDTLDTAQWEAWYQSSIRRLESARPAGSEAVFGSWHSWRESMLEWPDAAWTSSPTAARHPALVSVVEKLRKTYLVDVQAPPPMAPTDLPGFFESTAPATDPYGWGVLQRFGLSVALLLRNPGTREVLDPGAALDAVRAALDVVSNADKRHLHLEVLFQPGRSVELEERAFEGDALLALVQLSLRPTIRQRRRYFAIEVAGEAGAAVEIKITSPTNAGSITLVDPADPAAETTADLTNPVTRTVTIPAEGAGTLLARADAEPQVEPTGTATVAEFDVTDPRVANFTVPDLAASFESGDHAASWHGFEAYAERLTPPEADGDKIVVPTAGPDLAKVLPTYLVWSQRFFDASGDTVRARGGMRTPGQGPWLATAYPRAGSPAYASPDAAGRLHYDHLLQDQWGHNYRFYVRPNSRYGRLWRSLLQSPTLFTDPAQNRTLLAAFDDTPPDPEQPAVDVVLERVRPVQKPVILSSARLDPVAPPGQPVPPGTTWEVLVAEHPEQAMIEKNTTLARQLSFRQVAFTLLRRPTPRWAPDGDSHVRWLETAVESTGDKGKPHEAKALPAPASTPGLPGPYPALPASFDLDDLTDDEARALDLPLRVGDFHQGVLAIQWEALPFFYEYQLLVVAQATSVVSPVNTVTQRDFHYRSPRPAGSIRRARSAQGASRTLTVQLMRFWDSLVEVAQQHWQPELPNAGADGRSLSCLPDPEVAYQVVELFDGNIEVQAELYLDEHNAYQVRQLGRSVLATVTALEAPAAPTADSFYQLRADLTFHTEVALARSYDPARVPSPTRERIVALSDDGRLLTFRGEMSGDDRWNLLLHPAEQPYLLDHLRVQDRRSWYPIRLVKETPDVDDDAFEYRLVVGMARSRPAANVDAAAAVARWRDLLRALAAGVEEPTRTAIANLAEVDPYAGEVWIPVAPFPGEAPYPTKADLDTAEGKLAAPTDAAGTAAAAEAKRLATRALFPKRHLLRATRSNLSPADQQAVRNAFGSAGKSDQAAVEALIADVADGWTLAQVSKRRDANATPRGGKLFLMARRGNAAPSELEEVVPK